MADLKIASERMSSLEDRILALEGVSVAGGSTEGVEAAVANYQEQMLIKLKAIRDQLVAEGGDLGTVKAQRDAAVCENAVLKKEIERLNYRVRHLIKALEEEESKSR